MDLKKERELMERFRKFHEELPPKMVLRGTGLDGEDIVLQKKDVDDAPFYSAPMDVPLWGGGVKVSDYSLKEGWARICQFFRSLWRLITSKF